ncbi:prepilin-type N-terminal cleavage/methylation domain-containing protein [Sedimenticola selenatireducens]|uniref:prepilin-type N-terminal cleavage/methylation domain-containing protein n=1 Tax=Sedimenticola selenatireducens TaxID=191960 RepID=UPI0004AC7621|nr:prepilin-type N-terminal cleavage/methylation domain-containing protein [Sedimenticola selenatireducens]
MYRREHGFTLIEFLIALVLISLISSLLFAGVRLGGRSWESVESTAAGLDEMRLARDFLRRTLSRAQAIRLTDKQGSRLLFQGDQQILEWVAPLPEQSGQGGLALFRLSRMTDTTGSRLLLDRWLYHPDIIREGQLMDGVPLWQPLTPVAIRKDQPLQASPLYGQHLLLQSIGDFSLAYYGQRAGENGASWGDQWLQQETFPDLLRIRMRSADDDWPDMLIALHQLGGESAAGGGFVSGPR